MSRVVGAETIRPCKAQNIYYLAFSRKCFLPPELCVGIVIIIVWWGQPGYVLPLGLMGTERRSLAVSLPGPDLEHKGMRESSHLALFAEWRN